MSALAPAPARLTVMLKVGGLIISVIAKRTSQLNTNWAWRIPFTLFFIIPTIVASLIWLLPEVRRVIDASYFYLQCRSPQGGLYYAIDMTMP